MMKYPVACHVVLGWSLILGEVMVFHPISLSYYEKTMAEDFTHSGAF